MLTKKGMASLYGYFCKQAALTNRQIIVLPLDLSNQSFVEPAKELVPVTRAPVLPPSTKRLTAKEAMDTFKISKATLGRWQKAGLQYKKIGGKRYYQIGEVENFIDKNAQI